jgi:hypothetical protein
MKFCIFSVLAAMLLIQSNASDCDLDEMDLCLDVRSFGLCDEDEMDLCPGTATACAEDEMDLCDHFESVNDPHSVCDEDEMDLCPGFTTTIITTTKTVKFLQPVSIQGTFSMSAPGATQSQVEQAVRGAVAKVLNVPLIHVTEVSATQSRRLLDSVSAINSRQLQSGSWFVAYKVSVEESVWNNAAQQTMRSLENDLTPLVKELRNQFHAMRLVDTAMAVTVESFFSAVVKPDELEHTAHAVSMCGKFSVALALVLVTVLAPESKSGGLVGAMLSGPAASAQ